MKQIEVIVNNDGTVSIDAIGFKGNTCEKATEELRKAFAIRESKKKPEYYAINNDKSTIRVGQN